MKNYKRFRVAMEVVNTVLAAIAVASFVYFLYEFIPTLPIYD